MSTPNLVQILEHAGWSLKRRQERHLKLNEEITRRYRGLPAGYLDFLASVEQCVAPDEKSWFLCESDYNGTTDSAYAWNECEQQSLEAADGDESWKKEISTFWSGHFPIFFSVRSGYAFLAIRLSDGAIVHGREPEYEDVEVLSTSFEEFVDLLYRVLIEGQQHPVLATIF